MSVPIHMSFNLEESVFSLWSLEYTTKISIIGLKQKVWKWPGCAIGTFDFTCKSEVILNPCISAMNQNFGKWRKCFLIRVLGMYHKNFKHLPGIESIEVARATICGFDNQKSPFSGVFLRFSQEPLKILKNKELYF